MNWADLFERAETHRTDVATIRERLAARRDEGGHGNGNDGDHRRNGDPEEDADHV